MNLKKHNITNVRKSAVPEPGGAFLAVSDVRVRRLSDALSPDGANLVLTGEPGCGKSHLAQRVANAFAAQSPRPVQQVLVQQLAELLQLCQVAATATPREASELVLSAMRTRFPEQEIVLVALGLDSYHGDEAAFFEHLVRARQLRFIGTAHQVVGAADRLARDPGVTLHAVEPFTIDESDAFLSRLFGVDHFARQALEDWYAATLGNPHALATLALAADRRGAIHRARRMAWITSREDQPPADFVAQLDGLSALERDTIELVTFAEPLHEAALLQLLDTDTVTALLNKQLLVVRTDASGITAVVTRLPIVGAAIREHLSPTKRNSLATLCFNALLSDDATLTTTSRKRLVRFGMAAGRQLPADWLWQAMRAAGHSGELHYTLRLALAAMAHEDPPRSAEAILRASDLAHFLGEREALDEAMHALTELLADHDTLDLLPFEMQFTLAVTSICFAPEYTGSPELALAAFDRWEQHWAMRGLDAHRVTQSCRMRVLTLHGQLRNALTASSRGESEHDLNSEWLAAPARTFEALVRVQRGQFQQALALAETTRKIILLHEISPTISGDLEGFIIFLAHWARGTTISARYTLEQVATTARADLHAVQSQTGLIDLGIILFSLQEARWNDAAELAERLNSTMATNDPFGITPFVQAALALALAALGEDERARTALHRSETRAGPGVSTALHGFLGTLSLRARHWLRDTELLTHAHALADWASSEDLPLIELKALDIIAYQSRHHDPALLARAEQLVRTVDQPVGPAILAHIRAMQFGTSDADSDERLLSELGIWMPLPPVSQLTGREREIALFTSLGYSSKYVAERLQLSVRTVETHLTHVYSKLGIEGREELRLWFSRGRENN